MSKVLLECGCEKDYPKGMPQVGTIIRCKQHNITAVASPKVGVWTTQCLDCQYRRYPGDYGGTLIQARVLGSKHMSSRRHVVYSYRIGDFNGTNHRHAPNAVSTVGRDDPPPF